MTETKTRKRGNCKCIATWGRPSHASPFPLYLQRHARFEVDCRITALLLLIHYFTPWPWPLTFDLEHLQRIVCDVTKLYQIWTWRSYSDFSVWPYDLEHVLSVALGTGIISIRFDLRQLIHAWIIAFFMLIRYVMPWPLARWSWNSWYIKRHVIKVRNLSEIEQSAAELLIIFRIFAYVMSRRDLDLWPIDLKLLHHFGCHAFRLFTKCERNRIILGWVINDLARFCVDPTSPNLART